MANYMTEAFREECERATQAWMDEQFKDAKLVIELFSGKRAEILVSVTSAKGAVLMEMPPRELDGPGCSLIVEGLKIRMDNTVRMD